MDLNQAATLLLDRSQQLNLKLEQLEKLKKSVDYLTEASNRLGRKDYMLLLIGWIQTNAIAIAGVIGESADFVYREFMEIASGPIQDLLSYSSSLGG